MSYVILVYAPLDATALAGCGEGPELLRVEGPFQDKGAAEAYRLALGGDTDLQELQGPSKPFDLPVPPTTEYRENNSGGRWRLRPEHWEALRADGWAVGDHMATLRAPLDVAMARWAAATGLSPQDRGCPCCGPPHCFTVD